MTLSRQRSLLQIIRASGAENGSSAWRMNVHKTTSETMLPYSVLFLRMSSSLTMSIFQLSQFSSRAKRGVTCVGIVAWSVIITPTSARGRTRRYYLRKRLVLCRVCAAHTASILYIPANIRTRSGWKSDSNYSIYIVTCDNSAWISCMSPPQWIVGNEHTVCVSSARWCRSLIDIIYLIA